MHETGTDMETIKLWIKWVVEQSTLDQSYKDRAYALVLNDWHTLLRGDISDRWINAGFTNEQFNFKLYV